ncbi:5-oxoprolinase subunit PxpA [Cohnella endophytica]|uniref:5-oxoprolinase subunit PxpA n=1 Tax=Cohnella endophytica TaxID=2419778 RepID=A0A494Y252_9BACL|nr:5-oxoprolinase subunit PxpA [Cohnella endophytica]RKP53936.1 5-oxoprolinase subunit PxpA [Cohnella endophytica]
MITIDLNADMGEGFGAYEWGADTKLLDDVTSANIACGFHAGDPHIMRATVASCMAKNVAIGAHPGLPDRLGFGRREMKVTPEEAADFVLYQAGALQAFVRAAGGELSHVKLHGALYHMAAGNDELALSIANAVRSLNPALSIYGLSGSCLHEAANKIGIRFVSEGFADRAYTGDGKLLPRNVPGSVLSDAEAVARQAVSLALAGRCETICLHGDAPYAAEHAKRIAESLRESGVAIHHPTRK